MSPTLRLAELGSILSNSRAKRGAVVWLNREVMFGPGAKKENLWAWWNMDQRPFRDGITVAMAVMR